MNIETRQLLFVFVCMSLRFLLAYLAYTFSSNLLPYLGIILFIIGANMLYLYFTNGRLNAPEGGGVTWWKNLRLLHGSLFICAAIYAFNKDNYAYIPLLIDPIIGLLLFIQQHKLF